MSSKNPVSPSELEKEPIPDHDGLPVVQTAAIIRKTGDGLSESMGMSPIHIQVEETVLVLIVATAKKHDYQRVVEGRGKDKETLDCFRETVVLDAESALFLDPDLVSQVVEEHKSRVTAARNEARLEKERKAAEARGEFQMDLPEPTVAEFDGDDGDVDEEAAS